MKNKFTHPYDYAQELITLPIEQQVLELQKLDFDHMVEVFEYLPVNRQQDLIEVMEDVKLNELFRELEYDTIDDLIEDDEDLIHRSTKKIRDC